MANYFDYYYFSGSYRDIGRQYGEAIREKLQRVYEENLEKLICQDGIPEENLRDIVNLYYLGTLLSIFSLIVLPLFLNTFS